MEENTITTATLEINANLTLTFSVEAEGSAFDLNKVKEQLVEQVEQRLSFSLAKGDMPLKATLSLVYSVTENAAGEFYEVEEILL